MIGFALAVSLSVSLALTCGLKISMCSLLAQLSTKSSLELPEAAYGAECDVVIMTRRPACSGLGVGVGVGVGGGVG